MFTLFFHQTVAQADPCKGMCHILFEAGLPVWSPKSLPKLWGSAFLIMKMLWSNSIGLIILRTRWRTCKPLSRRGAWLDTGPIWWAGKLTFILEIYQFYSLRLFLHQMVAISRDRTSSRQQRRWTPKNLTPQSEIVFCMRLQPSTSLLKVCLPNYMRAIPQTSMLLHTLHNQTKELYTCHKHYRLHT